MAITFIITLNNKVCDRMYFYWINYCWFYNQTQASSLRTSQFLIAYFCINKILVLLKKMCLYWFLERERERNINVREKTWLLASCMCPKRGRKPSTWYMPWLGTELVTLQCTGQRSTDPATPARAVLLIGPTWCN